MKHKISIITVCYNDLDSLVLTYRSIVSQIYSNIEWIVVDGNSSDGTVEFLKSNNFISKYISEADSGIYDAMNKGTALASGSYLIYLNAGDILYKNNSLADCVKRIDNQDVILCGAFFLYNKDKSRYRAPRSLESIWHSIPANHQAILFKKSILGHTPYDTIYRICGDYDLMARLYVNGASYSTLNMPLVSFEVGGISTFSILDLSLEALRVQINVLKLNWFSIAFSFVRRLLAMYINLFIFKVNRS